MAKPDKPLLSFGASGTIANTLTFQKRGRGHFVREKPIPQDPKSPAQLAQRQIYKDAVATWHALSPEEKEAWRGVCPGLTAYQCFMSSELKYVPAPIPIDIGAPAINRALYLSANLTTIALDNPANATGILHTVEIWADEPMSAVIVGTFYLTHGTSYKCRDSAFIGNIPEGSKQTFSGLSIQVEAADLIGIYFTSGTLELDNTGYAGIYYAVGKYIDPGESASYTLLANMAVSLYGIGETQP